MFKGITPYSFRVSHLYLLFVMLNVCNQLHVDLLVLDVMKTTLNSLLSLNVKSL